MWRSIAVACALLLAAIPIGLRLGGRVAAYELGSGAAHDLPRFGGYADLGDGVSEDGHMLLVLRRRSAPGSRAKLWSAGSDGSDQRPLVRLTVPSVYYVGFYPHLDQVAWSR